jgi:hypothetical protein
MVVSMHHSFVEGIAAAAMVFSLMLLMGNPRFRTLGSDNGGVLV